MRFGALDGAPRAGQHLRCHEVDLAELDAFHAQNALADPVDLRHPAAQNDDLKAVVLVQVHMQRGDGLQEMGMLQADQLLGQLGRMVIVDQ